MLLFVGLGNPGTAYARQRHNVGFMAIDAIAAGHRFPPFRTKYQSGVSEGPLDTAKVLLMKPQTFMNLSGHAVAQAVRFYKLAPTDVIVFHDEIDLAPGKLRIKVGGGTAGHNGLRSLAAQLGTPDFKRVRIGIGHPGDRERVHGHVLGDFAKADRDWLEPLLDGLVEAAPLLACGDDAGAMNKVALRLKPPARRPTTPAARESPASAGNGGGEPGTGKGAPRPAEAG